MISSLPITIFYPALDVITKDLHTTASAVNLGVSGYKLIQAFAPTLWGPLSDQWGRRPLYIITMPVAAAACAGIGASSTVYTLIVLRMLQAFAGSAIPVTGSGVITDISTPATRAGYSSYGSLGYKISLVSGPILGGIITQHLSWRWIFWVLPCFIGSVFLIVVMFLPETLPALAGRGYNPTPLQWIQSKMSNKHHYHAIELVSTSITTFSAEDPDDAVAVATTNRFRKVPSFHVPFHNLLEPDILVAMLISASYFGAKSCYLVNMSYLFRSYYHLNVQNTSLCFLAQSIGTVASGFIVSPFLNRTFPERDNGSSMKKCNKVNGRNLPVDFPIYRARLLYIWYHAISAQILTAIHGWIFLLNAPVAVPLVLQFFLSINIAFVNSGVRCLVMDLRPAKGASTAASLTMVRLLFSAIGTALVDPLMTAVGVGWMYTLLGAFLTISNILLLILLNYGPAWRFRREQM
ncbi:major facilitator superfamily domain-containing protein [Zychaea mexicana]|uniref:major facilitator superfamily domain-containing protein n=1 Tax=Zychaea mexicana TaxID=64656 RepID=UPI0022FE2594|nr:major facilitator superfamily domain-containing protein [Zychaea mexicana]KAI9479597.1 major facilitator superfamily domain-containing protein [Zychaea mexicana]